jgi:hypothetical protein
MVEGQTMIHTPVKSLKVSTLPSNSRCIWDNSSTSSSCTLSGALIAAPEGLQQTMEEISSCPRCKETFDSSMHMPLLLPACGHTFCKACISSSGTRTCFVDGSSIPKFEDLPTNILLLRSSDSSSSSSKPQIPGMSDDVRVISSENIELQQKVGEGASGQVWKALYNHRSVSVMYCFGSVMVLFWQCHEAVAAATALLLLPVAAAR